MMVCGFLEVGCSHGLGGVSGRVATPRFPAKVWKRTGMDLVTEDKNDRAVLLSKYVFLCVL